MYGKIYVLRVLIAVLWKITIFVLLSDQYSETQQVPLGPIEKFIRANLVGQPVIHEKTNWVFDPEVALKRRRQFIKLHGDKGEKLIERLGLGIDGRSEERLEEQRKRDEGHLGGRNFYLP